MVLEHLSLPRDGATPGGGIWLPPPRAHIPAFFLSAALVVSFFFNGEIFNAFLGAMAFLVLALASCVWFTRCEGRGIAVTPVSVLLFLLAGYLFLTLLWSQIPYVSVMMAWWLAAGPLAAAVLLLAPRKEALYKTLLAVALLAGIFQGGLAMYQYFVQEGLPNGLFLYKNLLGGFISLPLFALTGVYLAGAGGDRRRMLFLPFLFFFAYLLGFIQSRGVILSFSLAMLFFLVYAGLLGVKHLRLVALGALFLLALVGANWATSAEMGQRLATLESPFAAGNDRLLIWAASLEMIRDNPWWGTGLGTYWLLWPPYRNPADTSGGFFVHNDYLQFWIEGGLPLLLILVLTMGAVAVSFYRTMRDQALAPAKKLESLALFSGLGALAIHTFFDFNFYNIPTMIMAGLFMGRLETLREAGRPSFSFDALRLRPGVFNLCLCLITAAALAHFLFLGLSYHYTERGNRLAAQGQLVAASESLGKAQAFWNDYDRPFYLQGGILAGAVGQGGDMTDPARRTLYEEARQNLDRAIQANPFRPRPHVILGRLEEATGAPEGRVRERFRRALALDPLYFPARMEYARFLLTKPGRQSEALAILEKGLIYHYPRSPAAVSYFRLIRDLRKLSGDTAGAAELEAKIAAMVKPKSSGTGDGKPD